MLSTGFNTYYLRLYVLWLYAYTVNLYSQIINDNEFFTQILDIDVISDYGICLYH